MPKLICIQMSSDKNKLVSRRGAPFFSLEVKPRATELKNVAQFAFLKPENAFGSKYILRELFLQEVFKLVDMKGAIALKCDRHKSIIIQVR